MFGKLRAWRRRHRMLVDNLMLAPFVLLCLAYTLSYDEPSRHNDYWPLGTQGYLLLSAALIVPLGWRRPRPRETFAVVALISFFQWLGGVDPIPANLAVLIAMYGVASRCRPPWAILALLTSELGLALALVRWNDLNVDALASSSTFVVAIWIWGIYVNTRRRYLESLEERAERAERERDQQAAIAAAAERSRIARELHDVVAHNVSVMVVQADGAGYAIDSDPERARQAVQTISATGRKALAEMRRLVGVLREGAAEEYAPQPGLAQLGDLVRHVTASGVPVEFLVRGVERELPETEQLAVYRIVQEALTNTLKHGGPGARAWVELEYGPRELTVRVADDGRGAAAPRSAGGHGLVGMRERVAMYGGSLQAGPRTGGGFQVVARFPVNRAA